MALEVNEIWNDHAGIRDARRAAAKMPIEKNRALYVDFENGAVQLPDDRIGKERAEAMIAFDSELLEAMDKMGFPPRKGLLAQAAATAEAQELYERVRSQVG